tara:strand:+ start:11770 stop:11991 length:222 start_codon:yes stop_codon:yes gene_type:complete
VITITELFDVRVLNIRLKTRKRNGGVVITLPKDFCKRIGITAEDGEQIQIIVHEIIKGNKNITLCKDFYTKPL